MCIADVGCGTGATSRILADFGLDVVGVDLSPNMITRRDVSTLT